MSTEKDRPAPERDSQSTWTPLANPGRTRLAQLTAKIEWRGGLTRPPSSDTVRGALVAHVQEQFVKSVRRRRVIALFATLLLAAPLGGQAYAHEEREAFEPAPAAHPDHRDSGPSVVVCKPDSTQRLATLPAAVRERNEGLLARGCDFQHLQAAIDSI